MYIIQEEIFQNLENRTESNNFKDFQVSDNLS